MWLNGRQVRLRRRGPALWKVAAACVGVALVWQLAVGLAGRVRWRTAVAEWGTVKQESRVNAVIVRDERVYRSAEETRLFMVAAEGQRVARGEVVAILAESGLSDQVYQHLSEYCSMARQSSASMTRQVQSVEEELGRCRENEETARQAVELLPPEASEADVSAAESRWEEAGNLRFEAEKRLQSLMLEQASAREKRDSLGRVLLEEAGDGLRVFRAEQAGVVCTSFDGFEEHLTPETIRSGEVRLPKQSKYSRVPDGHEIGRGSPVFRLVDNYQLLLAVPLGRDAANVSLPPGKTVRVTLSEGESPDPASVLLSTGQYIVLSLNRFPPDCLERRVVPVELQWSQASGVKVPRSAVVTRQGQTGVTIDRGRIREFRPVTVLAQGQGFAVVEGIAPGTPVRW